ncbi:MAG: alpha/beta fold hydrolase [Proteobacteria bacterium]|nr:alpha/beta fold hydrolase [Pseudomonadota bacterium]
MNNQVAYGADTLEQGIRSRFITNVNGLRMHVLEAGYARDGGGHPRPAVLLVHGFPELAYSWRKLMMPLAELGFHVVAPDLRGYGRTTGWDDAYDTDLRPFRLYNFVQDMLSLVHALGHSRVAGVIGHDYGSPVAAWCALIRPDVFQSVALMSAPFGGTPRLPFNTADDEASPVAPVPALDEALAALPRPRRHYRWYYSRPEANANMLQAPQGVHGFLRAYFHFKSADWEGNRPHPLASGNAADYAVMPEYYIMDRALGMAETVARHMPRAEEVAACRWLTEAELSVYSSEYSRTGFQGGLDSYRCGTDPAQNADLAMFSGRTIDVPCCFIAGASDWGVYQTPGAFERMSERACTAMTGTHLIAGAGHWVMQEQPGAVMAHLKDLLISTRRARPMAGRTPPRNF